MSAPGYESYKVSGVKWLGDIPSHWPLSRLGYLSQSGMGQTILREMLDAEPNAKALPVFSASESDQEFGYLSSPTIVLAPGDLIVGARGSIGMARRVTVPSTCTQTTIWVRPNREITAPDYLYWSMVGGRAALFPFDKTAIPMLTVEQVRAGRIALPPPAEQASIAAFLDRETGKIDALVEAQTRLIELLKEKRQAVISHAVTKGLNPAAPMKDSGVEWLGEVPAHWEVVPIRTLFRFVKRQDGDKLDVLSVYRDYGVISKASRDDNNNVTPEDLSKYQTVRAGDLVVNKMKAWQGSLGVSRLSGITSPDYAVFQPLHRGAASYLHLLLRSQRLPDVYRLISNGIRLAQWRLEPDKFKELRMPWPPVAEQRAISAQLEEVAARMELLASEAATGIALLQERRAALISAAVTGKIDVRGLAPEQAEAA